MIFLNEIEQVSFTKIASNGQPCAITVSHKNGKYIYPVRLFNKPAIERLIADLNDISDNKVLLSEYLNTSIFDFSEKGFCKNFVLYVITIFMIILFAVFGITLLPIFKAMCSGEQSMTISSCTRYWGLYVCYASTSGIPQRTLEKIIMLKNNEITFYSHQRERKYSFTLKENSIEYKQEHDVTQRIFYDSIRNELFKKKPGKCFFIPEKIVFVPLDDNVAQKQIGEWMQ